MIIVNYLVLLQIGERKFKGVCGFKSNTNKTDLEDLRICKKKSLEDPRLAYNVASV